MSRPSTRRESYRHLIINRINIEDDRRRRRSGGRAPLPQRDNITHGRVLRENFRQIREHRRTRSYPPEINPDLIFIVEEYENQHNLQDSDFINANLIPLFQNNRGKYVLFASDGQAREFQERLTQYQNWTTEQRRTIRQVNPTYSQLYARLERVRRITSGDRLGPIIRDLYHSNDLSEEFDIYVNFWWLGAQRMNTFSREMNNFIENQNGNIMFEFFDYRTANMIIHVDRDLLELILNLDQVYQVDLIKIADIERLHHQTLSLQEIEEYNFNPPPEDTPYVCIIDTGIVREHPALVNIIFDERKFELSEAIPVSDEDGHGTENAGIIAYGDINNCLDSHQFNPNCKLLSAKISREFTLSNFSALIRSIPEAIRHYYNPPYNCRLFYLSFLNNIPLTDEIHPKDHSLSIVLDELINQYNIVIVCPTGNSDIFHSREEYMPIRANLYPNIMFENNRVLIGASGSSVLTIGSVAGYDENFPTILQNVPNIARFQIPASRNDLSPFTRIGPGFNDSIKPELLAPGGNEAFDAEGYVQTIDPLCILSLNYDFIRNNLFAFTAGTCISAAKVTHSLATLMRIYPGYTGNLYRALIVNNASQFNFSENFLNQLDDNIKNKLFRYTGYGILSNDRDLLYGRASKITLYNEDEITYDDIHYYQLPIPDSFRTQSRVRDIKVTLAYNPPIQPTRQEYSCITMRFYLIRTNEGIEDIRIRYGNFDQDSEQNYSDCQSCDISVTERSKGTIESTRYRFQRQSEAYRNAEYVLVVRCQKKGWYTPPPNENSQSYAIIITIEQEGNNRIYEQIQVRIRERIPVNI